MSVNKDYRPILIGKQFILKETDSGITFNTITVAGNTVCEAYDIYPEGRKFIGNKIFHDYFWRDFWNHLADNQRLSVTFYSESYTKSMMPDWIASNFASTIIAYSRIYKMFFDMFGNNYDPTQGILLYDRIRWGKRLTYNTGDITVTPSTYHGTLISFPFVLNSQEFPKMWSQRGIGSLVLENTISSNDSGSYNSYSFPNVEIDKFNILIPN